MILIPSGESNDSVVVVSLRVRVEIEIRVQLDNSTSVPLDFSVHRSAGGDRDAELADPSRDIKGLGHKRAAGQGDLGRGSSHDNSVNGVLHELITLGLSEGVRGSGGIPRVGPGPQVDLILIDLGKRSSLEGVGVVGGHVQPGGVIETVNPVMAVWLLTLDGTDVVGLAVVVPGDDLDNVDIVAVFDDGLPALVIQVIIRHVDPLKATVRLEREE